MNKTFAVTKNLPDLKGFRCHWFHDATAGLYYIVHWPRRLEEQLAFERVAGLTHLPHLADQLTRIPAEIVGQLPAAAGVTTAHNAYQALSLLHKHYTWDNFHPHG
jgi:hypothetical protein